MLRLPQGMILVTGRTGSGKSTTLYSSLLFVGPEGVVNE
jgi:type II secretory ATPase GspE/PulE/Tfp pilus assembly ATPase PilB-like protein